MSPLKIVIIDDENPHLLLMKRSILKEIPDADTKCFQEPKQAFDFIKKDPPDLIITDYLMPDMDGLEFIKKLKQEEIDVPIIMITGHGDEYVAVNAMKLGVMEYLVKSADVFDLLPGIIKRVLREKELKDELEKAQKRLQDIMEKTFNWIWETDLKGNFVYSNPVVEKIIGYKPEEILSRHYSEFFPKEEKEKLVANFINAKKGFFSFEHPFVHKHGDKLVLETNVFPIVNKRGEITGYRGISRDISARIKAELALKESEHQKELILDSSLDWIRYIDNKMRIIWVNKAVRSHLKVSLEKIKGRLCYEVILNRDIPCEGCPLIKAKLSGNIERSLVKKPPFANWKKETYWDIYCVPLKDEHGTITSFVEVARNITEQKEAEDRIRYLTHQLIIAHEQERRLISAELHDRVAQNLSVLRMGLDSIAYEFGHLSKGMADKIKHMTEILHQTITDIRNIAYDLRPPELDQFGIIKAIFQLCKDISDRAGLKLNFSVIGTKDVKFDPEIEINVYRLVQEVLRNIERHAKAKNVTVKIVSHYPKLIIKIKDDGIGFNVEEQLKKGLKEKKLGLRSIQERANLMGGKLRLKSTQGKGTTVVLEMPYEKKNHNNC
jgi:PAS domain S-box-containing protein